MSQCDPRISGVSAPQAQTRGGERTMSQCQVQDGESAALRM